MASSRVDLSCGGNGKEKSLKAKRSRPNEQAFMEQTVAPGRLIGRPLKSSVCVIDAVWVTAQHLKDQRKSNSTPNCRMTVSNYLQNLNYYRINDTDEMSIRIFDDRTLVFRGHELTMTQSEVREFVSNYKVEAFAQEY
jgi:hypothetical protein